MESEDRSLPLRQLFGGAVIMGIPARLVDVSDFRPVPDNQEVLADGSTDQSVIVEIMEHSSKAAERKTAAEFYYQDLANTMDATEISNDFAQPLSQADIPCMTSEGLSASLAVGKVGVAKGRQSKDASNVVQVALVAIQLPAVKSDMVVTLNTPMFISPNSAAAQDAGSGVLGQDLTERALQLLWAMLKTLTVNDWGLFGE